MDMFDSNVGFDQHKCPLWDGNKLDDMSTSEVHRVHTPRPTPNFFQQPTCFSTKKVSFHMNFSLVHVCWIVIAYFGCDFGGC